MKAVLVCGSRNHEGQTARAAEALLAGLAAKGVECDRVFLPELALERCRQCDIDGWGLCRREGRCVVDDDFAGIVDRIRDADVALFATPVYYGDLSESLRAFTDRLRRVARTGGSREGLEGKPCVGLCVAGGGGGGAPECCASMVKVLRTIGFDMVDVLPVRRQNLEARLAQLRLAGEWLASCPRSQ